MRQAQAGIMTHIALFKRTIEVDGVKKNETTVYVSILEGNDKQDANMVMCILESVFKHYKASNSNIEDLLYLKSGRVLLYLMPFEGDYLVFRRYGPLKCTKVGEKR